MGHGEIHIPASCMESSDIGLEGVISERPGWVTSVDLSRVRFRDRGYYPEGFPCDLTYLLIRVQFTHDRLHDRLQAHNPFLESLLALDAWVLQRPGLLTHAVHSTLDTLGTFVAIREQDTTFLPSPAFGAAMGSLSHPLPRILFRHSARHGRHGGRKLGQRSDSQSWHESGYGAARQGDKMHRSCSEADGISLMSEESRIG